MNKIHGHGEIQFAQRFAGAARVGVGHHRITAEGEKRFDRIGPFVEDRGEDVVGGAVARRRRRAERLSLAADAQRRRFFR